MKIPISTRHCIILIDISTNKSPYEWFINHTIANQNNPIIQTNKHEKHDIPVNTKAFMQQIKVIKSCNEWIFIFS